MKLADPLLCNQYELRQAVLHLLAADPSSATMGQMYYHTGLSAGFVWNGTGRRPMDAALLTDGSIQNTALQTNPLDRHNHFNTQSSSTIYDLKTTVTGYTLDSFAAPVASVNMSFQRLINGAMAIAPTDIPRWDQVQAYVQASVQGQTALKNPVRVYANGNVSLTNPPSIIDNWTLSVNDRILLGAQTTSTQNNIYVYNGAGNALTVATDCSASGQWIEGTEVLVTDGQAFGGAIFRQVTAGAITLGTTPLTFTQTFKINTYLADNVTTTLAGFVFSVNYDNGTMTVAGGSLAVRTDVFVRKYNTNLVCDGQNTSFNITHTLGTTDVAVFVRDSSGNVVLLDSNPVNSTTITLSFGSVQPQNTTFRVMLTG